VHVLRLHVQDAHVGARKHVGLCGRRHVGSRGTHGDHLPVETRGRQRPGIAHARLAEAARRRTRHRGGCHHGGMGEFMRIDAYLVGPHIACAGKRLRRDCREGMRRVAVDVVHAIDRAALAIETVLVVDVVDHRFPVDGARDPDVGEIDVGVVIARRAVPRVVDLVRTQREPAHRTAPADADEGHQRRRVHRPHAWRAGNPSPALMPIDPAAIVIGRETPGHGIYPGPAPRADPHPMAKPIRRPVGRHGGGVPHGAVVGIFFPVAVLVQILRADHIRRHVLRTVAVGVLRVAIVAPGVEFVAALDVADRHVVQAGIAELVAAAAEHFALGVVLAVDHTAAVEHGHRRAVAIGADIDPERTGLADHQGHGRRVDFVACPLVDVAHRDAERALRQLELADLVVEVQYADIGLVADAQRRAAQFQLGAGAGAAGQLVAVSERSIHVGGGPFGTARRHQAQVAGGIGKPRHTRRRVGAVGWAVVGLGKRQAGA